MTLFKFQEGAVIRVFSRISFIRKEVILNMPVYFLISLLIAVWLGFGLANYFKLLEVVDYYAELLDTLSEKRNEEDDLYRETIIFNQREALVKKYPPLESIRIGLQQQPRKTKIELLLSALVLGPLY